MRIALLIGSLRNGSYSARVAEAGWMDEFLAWVRHHARR